MSVWPFIPGFSPAGARGQRFQGGVWALAHKIPSTRRTAISSALERFYNALDYTAPAGALFRFLARAWWRCCTMQGD